MVDTVRTKAEILALLADNTTGNASPQDMRDQTVSAWRLTTYELVSEFVAAVVAGMTADDGEVVQAGDVLFVANSTATGLPGLPGYRPLGQALFPHFGAIADGTIDIDDTTNIYEPTGTGAVTGTDNFAALVAAAAWSNDNREKVRIPSGVFRCAIPNVEKSVLIAAGTFLHLEGDGPDSVIIMDDDPTFIGPGTGQTGNIFIGSAQSLDTANYDRGINDVFIIKNLMLRGTWWRDVEKGERSWLSAGQPYRAHALSPTNCSLVELDGVHLRDVLGFGSRGVSNQIARYRNCDLRRICGDGLRGEDCSNYDVSHNFILNCDDDSITNPDRDDIPNSLRPRRSVTNISYNMIVASEGPLVLGPANLSMHGNKLFRTYGTGLSAFTFSADTTSRGEGGFVAVSILGNHIIDHLQASNRTEPPDNTWQGTVSSMLLAGGDQDANTTADPIGEGTGTPLTEPWYSGDVPWGALHAQDTAGTVNSISGYVGTGLLVANNLIMRTLPPATLYSDWGYGKRFTRWGFDDPVVTDTEFATNAVQFSGWFEGVNVSNNDVFGFVEGAGYLFIDPETDMAYRNISFNGGSVRRCKHGIDLAAVSGAHPQDIKFDGMLFDLDPSRVQSARGTDNKWTGTGSSDPTCIRATFVSGLTILNCVFKNAANCWSLLGGVTDNNSDNATVRGNIGVCDFGEAGTDSTDADNRGLGRILTSSDAITYQVRDLDPSSGTYREMKTGMKTTAAARQTSGSYVRGHAIRLTDGTIDYRLTTGSAHVNLVDWVNNGL